MGGPDVASEETIETSVIVEVDEVVNVESSPPKKAKLNQNSYFTVVHKVISRWWGRMRVGGRQT